jgi:hypothetical protein
MFIEKEKFENYLPALHKTGLVVSFIKKNGEIRMMYCTLNFDVIPKQYHPIDENFEPIGRQKNFYRVFDVENCGWRCIPKGEEGDVCVIRVLEEGEAKAILDDPDSLKKDAEMPF